MSVRKISKECPHHPEELEYLLALAAKAHSILEIGSRFGDCLAMMARRMPVKGKVVAVDLPGIQPWGYPDSEQPLRENIAALKAEGFDARVIFGDSTRSAVIDAVQLLAPFDLVFIDGDHRYPGAKQDWENYGQMGRVVVFHDIVDSGGEKNAPEVWKLWAEIAGNKSQFVGKDSLMGLGIVVR